MAAGAAAALMVEQGWTSTAQVYDNIALLQQRLETLGSPLEWQS